MQCWYCTYVLLYLVDLADGPILVLGCYWCHVLRYGVRPATINVNWHRHSWGPNMSSEHATLDHNFLRHVRTDSTVTGFFMLLLSLVWSEFFSPRNAVTLRLWARKARVPTKVQCYADYMLWLLVRISSRQPSSSCRHGQMLRYLT